MSEHKKYHRGRRNKIHETRVERTKHGLRILGILILAILTFLITGLGTLLFFSVRWMFANWVELTMDELIFHLTAPLEGTNSELMANYMGLCAAPAILAVLLVIILFAALRNHKKERMIAMAAMVLLTGGLGAYAFHWAWTDLDISDYLAHRGEESEFVEDNYVDPRIASIKFPEQKRNLIYIYLESVEMTSADKKSGGAFEKNVIPELTDLALQNGSFSGDPTQLNGAHSMYNTTWTMGALFAATSGLPLQLQIQGNFMDTQESFFSGVRTLGDILKDEGYSQTFMIGSDATFGGRRLYFTEHGGYDIRDYNYAVENGLIPEDYYVWWGYEDEKLFDFAEKRLTELSKEEQPFNFTMLTVDTHFEDGWICDICPSTFGDNRYANTMACASRQTIDFIRWIQSQDFYENTTIVIQGDHPTMDSDYFEDIDPNYDRRVYTTILNPAEQTAEYVDDTHREYSTFDLFPTTLAAMGVQIEGDKLGLGVNLYSGRPTMLEELGVDTFNAKLKDKSAFLEELANLDFTDETLLMRTGKMAVAKVETGEYSSYYGTIPVKVSETDKIPQEIHGVRLEVWTAEDESDMIQIDCTEETEQVPVDTTGAASTAGTASPGTTAADSADTTGTANTADTTGTTGTATAGTTSTTGTTGTASTAEPALKEVTVYTGTIRVAEFGWKKCEYHIRATALDEWGNRFDIGETSITIE